MKLEFEQKRHVWLIWTLKKKSYGALVKEKGGEVLTYHTRREARAVAKVSREKWPEWTFKPIKVSVTFLEL